MTSLARLCALALLPLIAACGSVDLSAIHIPGITPPPPEEQPVPANVIAALPPGAPPSVAIRNGDGCWLFSVERTDPPSGFPLVDAAGNQICEPPEV